MSRPIIEPSNPREIGNTKFRTSQLERRPAPMPTTDISEYAWLSCTTQPTNPFLGTPEKIPWDIFLTTNTAVFDMAGSGATNLDCKAEGSYWFEVKVLYSDVGAKLGAVFAGTILDIDGSDGSWFTLNNTIVNTDILGNDLKSGIRDTLTAYIDPGDAPKTAFVDMWNFDGSDHDLNIGYLKAVYVPAANPLVQQFP